MIKTLRKKFAARSVVVLVAASAMLGGCALTSEFNNAGDPECIKPNQTSGFKNEPKKRLYGMLGEARKSSVADYIFDSLDGRNVYVCYEPDLSKKQGADGLTLGNYMNVVRRINLNTDYEAERLTETLVHEGRHAQQDARGLNWHSSGNVRPEERLAINWMKEADARLAGIVFAYEMQQAGEPEHMRILKRDTWYRPMIRAFERSLAQNPDDMLEAMRSSLKAFRGGYGLSRHYDGSIIKWLGDNEVEYDPDKPARTLLTDRTMMRLGDMAPYGNYMNEELMDFIRNSISSDYVAGLESDYKRGKLGFDDSIPFHGPPPNRMID